MKLRRVFVLLCFVLFLSGCEYKNEDFSRQCSWSVKSTDVYNSTKERVSFNNSDEVTYAVITKSYKAKTDDGQMIVSNVKKSATSYNNSLLKYDGVRISILNDSDSLYTVRYYLDVKSASDEVLDMFELKRNSIKFFNKMKKKGLECK